MPTIPQAKIKQVARDYATAFPGWEPADVGFVARVQGPVIQGMCFNRTSSSDYCPLWFLGSLISSSEHAWVMTFVEEVRNPKGAARSLPLELHQHYRETVIAEIRAQARPDPLKPLDVEEARDEMRRQLEEAGGMRQVEDLAGVEAYLGEREAALRCCERFHELADEHRAAYPRAWAPWDERAKTWMWQLESWLRTCTDEELKEKLERVIAEKKKLWGLVKNATSGSRRRADKMSRA